MSKHYSEVFTQNHIDGNVYIITGAGSGFGWETCLELLKMGGKVVAFELVAERLDELNAEAVKLGKADNLITYVGSTASYSDNQAAVKLAVDAWGKVDAFFANAGIMPLARLDMHEQALDAWDKCIDVNFKGVLYGICAVIDQFKAQGYGHFLTTSSIHGNYPTNGAAVYSGTKVAVRYLAKCLRNENPGIKSTIISPPGVPTRLYDSVVSRVGTNGIFGDMLPEYMEQVKMMNSGEHPEMTDNTSGSYLKISAEEMVWAIMFALNQPRGVGVSEVTMHSIKNYFQL